MALDAEAWAPGAGRLLPVRARPGPAGGLFAAVARRSGGRCTCAPGGWLLRDGGPRHPRRAAVRHRRPVRGGGAPGRPGRAARGGRAEPAGRRKARASSAYASALEYLRRGIACCRRTPAPRQAGSWPISSTATPSNAPACWPSASWWSELSGPRWPWPRPGRGGPSSIACGREERITAREWGEALACVPGGCACWGWRSCRHRGRSGGGGGGSWPPSPGAVGAPGRGHPRAAAHARTPSCSPPWSCWRPP